MIHALQTRLDPPNRNSKSTALRVRLNDRLRGLGASRLHLTQIYPGHFPIKINGMAETRVEAIRRPFGYQSSKKVISRPHIVHRCILKRRLTQGWSDVHDGSTRKSGEGPSTSTTKTEQICQVSKQPILLIKKVDLWSGIRDSYSLRERCGSASKIVSRKPAFKSHSQACH